MHDTKMNENIEAEVIDVISVECDVADSCTDCKACIDTENVGEAPEYPEEDINIEMNMAKISASQEVKPMFWEMAISYAKRGYLICRKGDIKKDYRIAFVKGHMRQEATDSERRKWGQDLATIQYEPRFEMMRAGVVTAWKPTFDDAMAEDWYVFKV